MRYELFISLRYLKAKRKQVFISIITFIAVFGIFLGVTALLITLSVMNGFQNDLRDKILGTHTHIVVLDQYQRGLDDYAVIHERIEKNKHVMYTAPFVYGQIMLRSGKNVAGAVVKGIVPEQESEITNIVKNMQQGNLYDLSDPDEIDADNKSLPGIVIGTQLSSNLNVGVNQEVFLISPMELTTPFGMMPRVNKFRVAGIFESGMYEYDSSLTYINIGQAQKLFNLDGAVTGIGIKIDDLYEAHRVSRVLQEELGFPYWARSWMVMNRNLFSALKLEKIMMFIILILIVLVAAFNIISTLIMMTMEKTRDIGILKAMGARRRSITAIFVIQGTMIGIMGTFFGCVAGYLSCILLSKYKFIDLPQGIYYINKLPVKIQLSDFIIVGISSLMISLIATIYPSWKAGKLDPCKAIRYE